jgi:Holliday junction resolvase RusA-like endonuclease
MYPDLPLEFVIFGTAISLQGSAAAKANWVGHVRESARKARGGDGWALEVPLAVTLYFFPLGEMRGDLDNVIKPILDGLSRCVYVDDRQIERIVVQKFEPKSVCVLEPKRRPA